MSNIKLILLFRFTILYIYHTIYICVCGVGVYVCVCDPSPVCNVHIFWLPLHKYAIVHISTLDIGEMPSTSCSIVLTASRSPNTFEITQNEVYVQGTTDIWFYSFTVRRIRNGLMANNKKSVFCMQCMSISRYAYISIQALLARAGQCIQHTHSTQSTHTHTRTPSEARFWY